MPTSLLLIKVSCTFDYLTRSTANIVYNYCLVFFEFVVPVFVIVVCYVGIVRAVSRHHGDTIAIDEATTGRDRAERVRLQQQKQAFKQEMKLAKVSSSSVL